MRRPVGVTLTGLGAFLLVLAAMCHFVLPGLVIKFPVNEYSVTRLTGTSVSYINNATGAVVNGATVRAVATTSGDVSASSSSVAVWNNITGVFDITSGGSPGTAINYTTERLAFDRRTGVLVNCCGAAIGTQHLHFSGQGYVFPIGTSQDGSYQIFDTTLLKPEPVTYQGTTTVDGLSVYKLVEQVPNMQIGTVPVPGSMVGVSQSTVNAPEYYTATNTYFVDPGTGSPVEVIQKSSQTLQNPATGATALVLFNGTLTTTPQSIAANVHTASTSDTEISLVQVILPLIFLLVGIVLLVLGILLVAGEEGEEHEYETDDEAVGAEA
jgi:hypothetical protein